MGKTTECACDVCKEACRRNPGWMTPTEALMAINVGHAKHLMCDWWEPDEEMGNEERVYILCPASGCHGGRAAPESDFISALLGQWSKGRCTFFTEDVQCTIHTSGFKPVQCRHGNVCSPSDTAENSNRKIARLWTTEEAVAAREAWHEALAEERQAAE